MRWKEGLNRGARTFFQTFGGALAGVSLTDALSKAVVISLGLKFASAILASVIAGVIAFSMNLGGEPIEKP